jgi:hypothetical protein
VLDPHMRRSGDFRLGAEGDIGRSLAPSPTDIVSSGVRPRSRDKRCRMSSLAEESRIGSTTLPVSLPFSITSWFAVSKSKPAASRTREVK